MPKKPHQTWRCVKETVRGYVSAARTTHEFLNLEQEWRDMFQSSSYPTPFSSWEWASEWWKYFGPHFAGPDCASRLYVVRAHGADGTLIGIAPFYRALATEGLLGPRRLIPLGVR